MNQPEHDIGPFGRPATRRGAFALFGAVALAATSAGRVAAQDDQNQGLGSGGRTGGQDADGGTAEAGGIGSGGRMGGQDAAAGTGGMAEVSGVGGSGRSGGQMTVTAMPATGVGAVGPNAVGAALLAAGAVGAVVVAARGVAVASDPA